MENYRTLKKEIEEDTIKWMHTPCSWVGRISITKMAIIPKAIYTFSAIPIKVPMAYIIELEQYPRNLHEPKKTPNSLRNLAKENKGGGVTTADINYTIRLP